MTKKECPNCFKCQHYQVTWDPKNPKGCKLFGIKSSLMPAQIVWQASGEQCQEFVPKKELKSEEYW